MERFPFDIDFDEERYTIPEVIAILGKAGEIPDYDDKGSKNYKTMYQSLRRLLEEVDGVDIKGSPRKQTFPREAIIQAVSKRVRLFRRLSPKEKDRTEYWAAKAKEHQKKMLELLETDALGPEEEPAKDDGGYREYILEALKAMQEQIMWDFLSHHCFDFDRPLLEHDLALEFTMDEQNPSAEAMEAIQRLEKPSNYYTLKPPFSD